MDNWIECFTFRDGFAVQLALFITYSATIFGIACYELSDWIQRMRLKP